MGERLRRKGVSDIPSPSFFLNLLGTVKLLFHSRALRVAVSTVVGGQEGGRRSHTGPRGGSVPALDGSVIEVVLDPETGATEVRSWWVSSLDPT